MAARHGSVTESSYGAVRHASLPNAMPDLSVMHDGPVGARSMVDAALRQNSSFGSRMRYNSAPFRGNLLSELQAQRSSQSLDSRENLFWANLSNTQVAYWLLLLSCCASGFILQPQLRVELLAKLFIRGCKTALRDHPQIGLKTVHSVLAGVLFTEQHNPPGLFTRMLTAATRYRRELPLDIGWKAARQSCAESKHGQPELDCFYHKPLCSAW